MNWIRLYTDLLDDTKIFNLTANQFKIWIFTLLLAREINDNGRLSGVNLASIGRRFRIKRASIERAFSVYLELKMLHKEKKGNEEIYVVTNWKKRQYESDNVTKRVNKYRKMKRYKNVSETFSESESESETDNINKSAVSGIPKSINNTKSDQKKKSGADMPEAADDFEFFIREKHKDITGKSLNSNNQTNIQTIEELRNYPIEIINIAADITKRRGGKGLKYLLRVVETEYNNPDNYIKSREKMIHHCTKDGAAIHKFSLKHNNGKFDQDPEYGFYMCLKCRKQWNSFGEIKCRE